MKTLEDFFVSFSFGFFCLLGIIKAVELIRPLIK